MGSRDRFKILAEFRMGAGSIDDLALMALRKHLESGFGNIDSNIGSGGF